MDRDLALKLSASLTNIKTTLTALATNTIPTAPDSRSVDQRRSVPAADPEDEPEAPEEPETRTKK